MNFLYPQFLYALFALAIPVIIHLFNFRRYKKILFTNVRFLTDIQQESKSRNRLRHLLLLAIRMLALAAIIIAFAQPYTPHKKSLINPGRNYVFIYLDNSFSMSNVSAQGDLLQLAKKKAEETAKAYRESDAFQLLTNDFETKHKRWFNRGEFLQLLNEVTVSPVSRKLSEINARARESFRDAESSNKFVYLFSDFQESMADFPKLTKDTGIIYTAVPLKANEQNNVYIDTSWFENSVWQVNQANTVFAKVVNASDKDIEEGTLTLTINGKQKALSNFNIAAHGQTEVKVNFTISDEGVNKAQLQINDYPITFDDNWYFTFPVAKFIPVLSINGDKFTSSVARVFGAEKAFRFEQIPQGNIDYSSFGNYKFITLNEVSRLSSGLASSAKNFIENGGNLLLIPSGDNADENTYNQLLSSCEAGTISGTSLTANSVENIDLKNPFFQNIFEDVPKNINLPEAKKYFKIELPSGSRAISLLKLSNGDPFLTMIPVGKGFLFVCAVPLEETWTNFANHALFLPLLYKMALYHSTLEKTSYTLGVDNYINIQSSPSDDKEHIYKLKKDKFEETLPQRSIDGNINLYVEGLIKESGFFDLVSSNNEKNSRQAFGFNYNRDESVMKFLSSADIKEKGAILNLKMLDISKASLTTEIKDIKQGSGLWKWFVILALLCIIAETILIRLYKQ